MNENENENINIVIRYNDNLPDSLKLTKNCFGRNVFSLME